MESYRISPDGTTERIIEDGAVPTAENNTETPSDERAAVKKASFDKDKKIKQHGKTGEKIFIFLMLLWPLLHLAFFSGYMNISTFLMSLFRYNGGQSTFIGFENYASLFRDIAAGSDIVAAVVNSVLILPVNIFFILPLAILFSYFLYRKVWGYKAFRVIFFLPSIISVVIMVVAFKSMFNEEFGPMTLFLRAVGLDWLAGEGGWFGSRFQAYRMLWMYILWANIGYNILLIQGSILRVPQEVIESGMVDGVGWFRELVQIIVPMVFSTISTMIIFGAISVFTLFIEPQLMFGTSKAELLTVPLYIVNATKAGGDNALASAATIGVLITLIGAPFMITLRWGLNKITPEVEY